MSFCPFQSKINEKVQCNSNCALALNYNNKPICALTEIAINLTDLEDINKNVKAISKSVYDISNN